MQHAAPRESRRLAVFREFPRYPTGRRTAPQYYPLLALVPERWGIALQGGDADTRGQGGRCAVVSTPITRGPHAPQR